VQTLQSYGQQRDQRYDFGVEEESRASIMPSEQMESRHSAEFTFYHQKSLWPNGSKSSLTQETVLEQRMPNPMVMSQRPS